MMDKKYYFISGLPRSGSTLLSSILNQNPEFYSGPSSPVLPFLNNINKKIESSELYQAYPKEEFKNGLTKSVYECYYSDTHKKIIFDKNRDWTRNVSKIKKYFQIDNPKIIVLVRDVDEILASFISMIRRSNNEENFIDSILKKFNVPINDFNRCQFISGKGPLGISYTSIQIAIESGFRDHLHFVEYNDLTLNPKCTMKKIYNFIEEEYYEHDFNNVENIHREHDDKVYGISDMHHVRSKVKRTSKRPEEILSKKIIDDVSGLEFWRQL